MKKKLLALGLSVMMAVALAGCGSSTAASTEASAESATTAAAGDKLQAAIDGLKDSPAASDGTITVGLNSTFPPFEYIGTDGSVTGFDVAMMNEIGKRLNLKIEISDMDFDGIVAALQAGKIDVAATGMTITDERKEAVNFSDPYYDASQSVLMKTDATIASADDLKTAVLECQAGTTGETVARSYNDAGTTSVKSFNQAVQDLISGKCDAVVIDAVPAEAFQSQYSDQLKVVEGSTFGFDVEQYGIAMQKEDTALQTAINAALAAMKADGTYDKIVDEEINNYEAEE